MAKRSRGTLSSHTRRLYKRKSLTINDYIKDIKAGDSVTISPHPVYRGAMPHMRYRGRVGVVSEVRGKSYVVEIMDGGIRKKIISAPMHITKVL